MINKGCAPYHLIYSTVVYSMLISCTTCSSSSTVVSDSTVHMNMILAGWLYELDKLIYHNTVGVDTGVDNKTRTLGYF